MLRRLFILGCIGFFGCLGCFSSAEAASSSLTLQHKHFLFTFSASDLRKWQQPQEEWTYRDRVSLPPTSFRVEGDNVPPLPEGWEKHSIVGWDRGVIAADVQSDIASSLDRPAGSVTISKNFSGSIVFEGQGLPGRTVDIPATTELILEALDRNIEHITLPVQEAPPAITVTYQSLLEAGIKEFVTIGESDFTGSPTNRRFNIGVGIDRFNGTLIPAGKIFSFNEILGRVDGSTGYRKELVIKGDRTEPDFGGGLCQVSTTAYRGVWEYGFPIAKRKNHSYAVAYYGPYGTDATVYPGSIDMTFKNDSPGALLIQSFTIGTKAYFVYYGTRDARNTEIVGPYTWGHRPAPPPRKELTIEIPPGTTQKVGSPVPGLHAAWFRVVAKDGKETTEKVSSIYEARPLYHLVGVTPEELPPPPTPEIPASEFAPL